MTELYSQDYMDGYNQAVEDSQVMVKEERLAVLSEVIDLIPNTYHEIAGNKLIAKIESLKHE